MKKSFLAISLLFSINGLFAIKDQTLGAIGRGLGATSGLAAGSVGAYYGSVKSVKKGVDALFGEEYSKSRAKKASAKDAAFLGVAFSSLMAPPAAAGYIGFQGGREMGQQAVAKYLAYKYGVSRRIAAAALTGNISLIEPENKKLLFAAQNKNIGELRQSISKFYSVLLGANWLQEIKTFLAMTPAQIKRSGDQRAELFLQSTAQLYVLSRLYFNGAILYRDVINATKRMQAARRLLGELF